MKKTGLVFPRCQVFCKGYFRYLSVCKEYQPVFPVWKRKNIGHEIGLPNNSDAVILIEKV